MLEQKIRLLNSMRNKESKERVAEFFREYEEAYYRLHKPSEHHNKDYESLKIQYKEYRENSR